MVLFTVGPSLSITSPSVIFSRHPEPDLLVRLPRNQGAKLRAHRLADLKSIRILSERDRTVGLFQRPKRPLISAAKTPAY